MDVQQMLDAKALQVQKRLRRWAAENNILPGHQILVTISTIVPVDKVVVRVEVPVPQVSKKGGVVATFRPLQPEEWTKILIAVAGDSLVHALVQVFMANNGKSLTVEEIIGSLPDALKGSCRLGWRSRRSEEITYTANKISPTINSRLAELGLKFRFRTDFTSPRSYHARRYAICPVE